jgi:hypothetical protein
MKEVFRKAEGARGRSRRLLGRFSGEAELHHAAVELQLEHAQHMRAKGHEDLAREAEARAERARERERSAGS